MDMDNCFNNGSNAYITTFEINPFIDFLKRIALPAVCAFGVVGNILNLTILTRRKLQKSFRSLEQAANLCLIALAVSDLMFCILAFLTTFFPDDKIYFQRGFLFYYHRYCDALINVFILESTFLTVAMSLERYMAICFPLRQDLYLTTRRIKYIIVVSFMFSLLFNIPVILRTEVIECAFNNTMPANISKFFHPIQSSLKSITDTESKAEYLPSNSLSSVYLLTGDENDKDNTKANNSFLISSLMHTASTAAAKIPSMSSNLPSPVPYSSSNVNHLPSTISTGKSPHIFLSNLHPTHFSPNNPNAVSESLFSIMKSNASILRPNMTEVPSPAMHFNQTSVTAYKVQYTQLLGSYTWSTAYRAAWALIGNFIPLALLFFFNARLCHNIYESYKLRKQFKRQNQTKSSSHILTVTLVVIVVMFFILVAPSEIALLTKPSEDISVIFNFLQSLNFSVNFILYCIISRHFRKTLKYLLVCGYYNIYHVTSKDWKKEFETSLM